MKKLFTLLFLLITSLAISLHAEDYIVSTGDGDKGEKTVTGSLNFYDSGAASGNCQGNYGKMVTFIASNPNNLLKIEMKSFNNGDTGYMNLYNGDPEWIGWNSAPQGSFATYTHSDFSSIYTSQNDTLTIFCRNASGTYPGWHAVITEMPGSDMEYVSCNQSQDDIIDYGINSSDVPLLKISVNTQGNLNPINLNEIQWDLTGTTDIANIANIKLYQTSGDFNTSNLIASKNTITNTGSFIQDITLSNGSNIFWIAIDFTASAPAGAVFDISCPSIKVNSTTQNCSTTSPAGNVTILNEALLTSTPKTYTIGDLDLNFYDDGGKDGEFTRYFEGQATFVPNTTGEAVQIEFTSVDINDFGGTKDILKVYNGSSVDESQLISNISGKGQYKSTASNGALTLVFKSKAYYTRNGFKAVISKFTPQQMVVKSTEITQATTATVSSQEQNAVILKTNIVCENTLNPLEINNFHINVVDYTTIKNVKIYTSNQDEIFNTSKLVGEALAINSNELDITINTDALKEGNNFFWVCYDMQNFIAKNTAIDASIGSITISNTVTDLTATGNPDGERLIDNKITSRVGNFDYSIQGPWLFTHHANEEGTKYAKENGDQITEFTPATVGEILKLQFTDFQVKRYGATEARFEIYSGKGDTKQLLWSVQSDDDAENGPGSETVFRSSAVDGSLTIIFNADDPASNYYCGAGWHATVTPFVPSDMIFQSIEVTQATTDVVSVGGKNALILGMNIQTQDDKNPLLLQELTVDTKSCFTSIDSIKIFSTVSNTFELGEATLVAQSAATSNQVTIVPVENNTLRNGNNYYWISYNINPLCASNTIIDAKIISAKLSGTTHTPTLGDPDGERTAVKQFVYKDGNNGTITVAGSLNFYDTGNKTGEYGQFEDCQVTFQPSDPTKVIKINITSLDLDYNAYLKFYYGSKVKEGSFSYDKQFGKFADNLPISFISESTDGCMTVTFESGRDLGDGFEILVEEYEPLPLSTSSIEATGADFTTVKGDSQAQMQKIAVTIGGEKGTFDFTNFQFTTVGTTASSINKAQLFYTGTSDVFSNANLFADSQVVNQQLSFTGTQQVDKATTYYFWLSYELSNTLAIDDVAKAQLTAYTFNGEAQVTLTNQTLTTATIAQGLSGDYTIGNAQGSDYATIQEAITALETGIEGPVQFLIQDGTYSGQMTLNPIKGSSSVNTVTFKAAATSNPAVLFKEEDSFNNSQAFFEINGADYIRIENIQFETPLSWNSIIGLKEGSQHITISHCNFTTTSNSMTHIKSTVNSDAFLYNHYLTIENCSFTKGHTGIEISGNSRTIGTTEKGLHISHCRFTNQRSKSLYVRLEDDFILENNQFEIVESDFDMVAIDFSATPRSIVRNNTIHIDETNHTGFNNSTYAMNIRPRLESETSTQKTAVYNNYILANNIQDNRNLVFCKYLAHVDFVYNTIRLDGSNSARCLLVTNSTAAYSIQNNIFQHLSDGKVIQLNTGDDISNATLNNNIYYTNGTVFGYAQNEQASFNDWATAVNEQNSQAMLVNFVDNSSAKLSSTTGLIEAVSLDYVTTDMFGIVRQSPLTPGATQYKSDEPTLIENTSSQEWEVISNASVTTILSEVDNYSITVFDMTGRIVSQHNNCHNNTTLNIYNTGLYIIRLQTTTTQTLCKVLVP